MGRYEWMAIGWLWKDKDGKLKANCDTCNKTVTVEYQQSGEYDSYICSECKEVVLGD